MIFNMYCLLQRIRFIPKFWTKCENIIMTMNAHSGEVRLGGSAAWEGRDSHGRHDGIQKWRHWQKLMRHVSNVSAIKNGVFKYGKLELPALFQKFNKIIITRIHEEGSKEQVLIANGLETRVTPLTIISPRPLRIENPHNPGAVPPTWLKTKWSSTYDKKQGNKRGTRK